MSFLIGGPLIACLLWLIGWGGDYFYLCILFELLGVCCDFDGRLRCVGVLVGGDALFDDDMGECDCSGI